MGQHALDGEMCLAGIGGAEYGHYATGGGHFSGLHLRRAGAAVKALWRVIWKSLWPGLTRPSHRFPLGHAPKYEIRIAIASGHRDLM
jgi:hypothetical protein